MSAIESSPLYHQKRLDDLQKIVTESTERKILIQFLKPFDRGGFYSWGHKPPSYDPKIYESNDDSSHVMIKKTGCDGSEIRYRFKGHIIFSKFLATAAPYFSSHGTYDTCDHAFILRDLFFKATAHLPVIAVFNLTSQADIAELNTNAYFPNESDKEIQSKCETITIRHKRRSKKSREHYSINHQDVISKDPEGITVTKKVSHIVVADWVDGEDVSFERLHSLVQKAKRIQKKNENGLIAVHCLAGEGRTGTFIVACEIERLFQEKILTFANFQLTVAALILTARDLRSSRMVTTEPQIEILLDYARILVNNPAIYANV